MTEAFWNSKKIPGAQRTDIQQQQVVSTAASSNISKDYTQYPIQGISQNASGFRPYLVIPYGANNPYVVTVTSLTK